MTHPAPSDLRSPSPVENGVRVPRWLRRNTAEAREAKDNINTLCDYIYGDSTAPKRQQDYWSGTPNCECGPCKGKPNCGICKIDSCWPEATGCCAANPKCQDFWSRVMFWWTSWNIYRDSPDFLLRTWLIWISVACYIVMGIMVGISASLPKGQLLGDAGKAIHLFSMITGNLLHAMATMGWLNATVFLLYSSFITLVWEYIGVKTGFPFGNYHYAKGPLGPMILDTVPLMVPFSYFMLAYPVYVIVSMISDRTATARPQSWGKLIWMAFLSAMIQTCFDVAIDPTTTSLNFYIWEDYQNCNNEVIKAYFCVPFSNYWGWMFVTLWVFLPFLCFCWILSPPDYCKFEIKKIPMGLPIIVYMSFSLLETLRNLNPSLALISYFTMGLATAIALYRWLIPIIPDLPSDATPKISGKETLFAIWAWAVHICRKFDGSEYYDYIKTNGKPWNPPIEQQSLTPAMPIAEPPIDPHVPSNVEPIMADDVENPTPIQEENMELPAPIDELPA